MQRNFAAAAAAGAGASLVPVSVAIFNVLTMREYLQCADFCFAEARETVRVCFLHVLTAADF